MDGEVGWSEHARQRVRQHLERLSNACLGGDRRVQSRLGEEDEEDKEDKENNQGGLR